MAAVLTLWRQTPASENDKIVVSKKGLVELEQHDEEQAREVERLRREIPNSVAASKSTRTRTSLRGCGTTPRATLGPAPSFRRASARSPDPSPATKG